MPTVLLHPYVPRYKPADQAPCWEALHGVALDTAVKVHHFACTGATDYARGLNDLWGHGVDIVICEHDIVPTSVQVMELEMCPENVLRLRLLRIKAPMLVSGQRGYRAGPVPVPGGSPGQCRGPPRRPPGALARPGLRSGATFGRRCTCTTPWPTTATTTLRPWPPSPAVSPSMWPGLRPYVPHKHARPRLTGPRR